MVENSTSAEVYHHPLWLDLLRSQYGYRFEACCVRRDGAIEAGIPIARIESRLTGRRLVSLPFSDACPPAIAQGAEEAVISSLGEALVEVSRRTGLGLTVHASLPEIQGAFVQPRYVHHLLTLSRDPTTVEDGYVKSRVKGAIKAKREGLWAERRTDRAALDDFYALHLETRRRLGVPTQPRKFIRRFAPLFDAGLGFVGLVRDEHKPIAAAVFLTYRNTVTYKYSATDAQSVKRRPNDLLLSEMIRWACEAGFQRFDFGRTDIDQEGLRSFKGSWGASEAELSYTYLVDEEPSLEPALRERIMTTTIQRSPALVGRLAGAALYRHFG